MTDQPPKDAQGFFHVNINCTDFAKSLAFYELIGFEKILDFDDVPGPKRSFGEAGLGAGLFRPAHYDGTHASRPDRMAAAETGGRAAQKSRAARHRPHLSQDQRLRRRACAALRSRLR